MPRPLFLLLTILFLAACAQDTQEDQNSSNGDSTVVDTLTVLNDPKSNLNIQTNSFSEIDSSGILMFPLSMGESGRNSSGFSYKEIPVNSFWNIIFLNSK